jgi:iron(III) transport system substrate-binding protein
VKKIALGLISLMLVPCAFAADLNKAKAEGQANLYANITAIEPLMEDFSATTGVQGIYTRISTAKYLSTVLTEHAAGKLAADLLQGPMPILQMLKEKGVLKAYKSPLAAGYPDWAQQDDTIMQFGIEYVAPIYNTELVKPKDVPTRYEDLTDPKWYDKIVMPDPASHATTITWLVGLKESKVFASEAAWMDFVKGLAANKPMFVKSFSPTPAPVESGEKLIAISMPKYIITKAPAPLGWAHVGPLLGTPRGQRTPSQRRASAHGLLVVQGRHEAPGGQGWRVCAGPRRIPTHSRHQRSQGAAHPRVVGRRNPRLGQKVQRDLLCPLAGC